MRSSLKDVIFLKKLPNIDIYFETNYFDMTKFLHESVEELISLLDEQDRNLDNDYYIIELLKKFLDSNINIKLTCFPGIFDTNKTDNFNIIKLIVTLCSISMVKFEEMKKIKDKTNEYNESDKSVRMLSDLRESSADPNRYNNQITDEKSKGESLLTELQILEKELPKLEKEAFFECLGDMEDIKKTDLFNKIMSSICSPAQKKNPYLVRFQPNESKITDEDILEIYTRFFAKYKEMLLKNEIGNNTIKPLLAAFQIICITKCGLQMPSDADNFKFEERPGFLSRQINSLSRFFKRPAVSAPAPVPAAAPAAAPAVGGSRKSKTKKTKKQSKKSRKRH